MGGGGGQRAGDGGCKQLALHQYRKLMVADIGKLCGNIVLGVHGSTPLCDYPAMMYWLLAVVVTRTPT